MAPTWNGRKLKYINSRLVRTLEKTGYPYSVYSQLENKSSSSVFVHRPELCLFMNKKGQKCKSQGSTAGLTYLT